MEQIDLLSRKVQILNYLLFLLFLKKFYLDDDVSIFLDAAEVFRVTLKTVGGFEGGCGGNAEKLATETLALFTIFKFEKTVPTRFGSFE